MIGCKFISNPRISYDIAQSVKNACENGNIHGFLQRLYKTYSLSYLFSTDEDGRDIATHVLPALEDFSMGCGANPKSSPVQALSGMYVCM